MGMDYFFITKSGIESRNGLKEKGEDAEKMVEDGRALKCLIVRGQKSKALFGHPVPQKGADAEVYSGQGVVEDVKRLGCANLILKSDNGPSIPKLVSTALEMPRVQIEIEKTSEEHPHRHDSQANGVTRVAAREPRGHYRTIKSDLEPKVGHGINPVHPLSMWMVEHCATILNVRAVGQDGRTPWRRIKGREFNMRMLAFAEQALYKLPVKGPEKIKRGNAAPNFKQATHVGFGKVDCEHRLVDGEGELVTSRHVMRVPVESRWSPSSLRPVTSTPWKSSMPRERTELLIEREAEVLAQEVAEKPPRRLYIMPWVLTKFGYAQGCAQCAYRSVHGRAEEGVTHPNGCRERIWRSLLGSQDGRDRSVVKRHTDRTDEEIATALQREDEKNKEGELSGSRGRTEERGTSHLEGGPLEEKNEPMREMTEVSSPQPCGAEHDPPGRIRQGSDVETAMGATEDETSAAMDDEEMKGREAEDLFASEGTNDMGVGLVEIFSIVHSLGAPVKGYHRERNKNLKKLVSEICSPPRVTKMMKHMPSHDLLPGFALDLTTTDNEGKPWDSDNEGNEGQGHEDGTRTGTLSVDWIADVHGILHVAGS